MAKDMSAVLEDPMEFVGPLADRSRWRADKCPAGVALNVVGSRSAMLIMREALYGTTRFDDFVDRVGITEGVASGRLRELTGVGLLARVPYREPGQRTRYEYRLTRMGADFAPVVFSLFEWGATYLTDGRPVPFDFEHRPADGEPGCGAGVHARIVCDAGHEVAPHEVLIRRAARGQRVNG